MIMAVRSPHGSGHTRLDEALARHAPRRGRRLAPWLVSLVALVAVAAWRGASGERPVAVTVVPVSRGEVERTVASVAAAHVTALRRARLTASVTGCVESVSVERGARVAKGALLVQLDAHEADAQLAAARSALDAARASVREGEASLEAVRQAARAVAADAEEAEAALATAGAEAAIDSAALADAECQLGAARSELARRRRLAPTSVSVETLERSEQEARSRAARFAAEEARVAGSASRIAQARARSRAGALRVAESRARIAALEAQLEERRAHASEAEARGEAARLLVARHAVRAPFAGTVVDLWVEEGEVVTAGGGVAARGTGARLVELVATGALTVTATVDEADLAHVKTGQTARVAIDAFPGESFPGTVVRVSPTVLDVEEQNRTVEVEVSLPAALEDRGLKPGASASVEVVVERRADVTRLPASVLVEGRRALLVEEDASGRLRATERELAIGLENWRFAEVSLPAGTRVIAGGVGGARVKPGALVTVAP